MFTESVRISCNLLACCGGSANLSNMFDISLTLPDS